MKPKSFLLTCLQNITRITGVAIFITDTSTTETMKCSLILPIGVTFNNLVLGDYSIWVHMVVIYVLLKAPLVRIFISVWLKFGVFSFLNFLYRRKNIRPIFRKWLPNFKFKFYFWILFFLHVCRPITYLNIWFM